MRRALKLLIPCLSLLLGACDPGQDTSKSSSGKAASSQGKAASGGAKAPDGDDGGAEAPKDLIREAPGVDLSKLPPPQREAFFETINTEASACDKPHSLAVSLRDDDQCRDSMHVAQFIADRIGAGAQPGDIRLELDALVAALKVREIDTTDRPTYGNERAPVTLVVFADFQCPSCKAEEPKLREVVDKHKGRVKLVFKHFPLTPLHPRGEAAAIAAEAAYQQDQFWEMADKLFGNQQQLEDEDLARYAEELGLDVGQFRADMASEEIKAVVAKDKADGERMAIDGTPTVYINGREIVRMLWGGDYDAWIEDALRR